MKLSALLDRKFFFQGNPAPLFSGDLLYLRMHSQPSAPGRFISGQRIYLCAGGTFDLVSESFGGEGLGRVSYSDGINAEIKRDDKHFTYRFTLPERCMPGDVFSVSVLGHDRLTAFRFDIEVGTVTPLVVPPFRSPVSPVA